MISVIDSYKKLIHVLFWLIHLQTSKRNKWSVFFSWWWKELFSFMNCHCVNSRRQFCLSSKSVDITLCCLGTYCHIWISSNLTWLLWEFMHPFAINLLASSLQIYLPWIHSEIIDERAPHCNILNIWQNFFRVS